MRSFVIGVVTTMIVAMTRMSLAGFEDERSDDKACGAPATVERFCPDGQMDFMPVLKYATANDLETIRLLEAYLADTDRQMVAIAEVFRGQQDEIRRLSLLVLVAQDSAADLLREIRDRNEGTRTLMAALGMADTEEERVMMQSGLTSVCPHMVTLSECDLARARSLAEIARAAAEVLKARQ